MVVFAFGGNWFEFKGVEGGGYLYLDELEKTPWWWKSFVVNPSVLYN